MFCVQKLLLRYEPKIQKLQAIMQSLEEKAREIIFFTNILQRFNTPS